MDYHYSDICMPTTDQIVTDQFGSEYSQQYMVANGEAEYEVRNSVLVDGGDRFGVSAVVFDKHEELIWMGNQGGHVTSYYGPSMQKYTSFQVHESEEVRDILTVEDGIYALTKTTLRNQIRRGLPKKTYKSSNMTDMQCLLQIDPERLLLGGHQDKLIDLDLTKMEESTIQIEDGGCAVMRAGGGAVIACGSISGLVTLRDLRCPSNVQHSFRAHSACISDLDMQGDLLITSGFTQSADGVAVAEPYVIVWDVRRIRGGATIGEGGWTVATPAPPLLLHFLPAVSGRAVAVTGDGQVALIHVNENDDETQQSVFQVNTQNTMCKVFDVSSTSQAVVFGDQSGHLHLFSARHNTEPVFNNFSRSTEFADTVEGLPFVNFSDKTFQFSSVPLPTLATGAKYFNQLPPEFFKKIFRKPKPIDAEVINSMKMQGPIGYAPNPKTSRRNQIPYLEDTLDDLTSCKMIEVKSELQPIPKCYTKMESSYNNQESSETEAEIEKKPKLPGIESTLPNSYCNSMLQVLYYTPPVKATLLAHTCAKEFCLSCELGFLFRMLDSSNNAPCQATNFLRAFRTVPEAAALGLILPNRGSEPRADLVSLIQSWNRFILHQMHYEILETRKKEKELAILAQNSSPPKSSSRMGNSPLNHGKLSNRLENAQGVNGHAKEEFQYTELEFLGPTSELEYHDGVTQQVWAQGTTDDGVGDADDSQACDTMDLANSDSTREETEISELFAIGRLQLNRCLKCNKEEERDSVVLACALQYPNPAKEANYNEQKLGFLELLKASLASRRSTPAWCERCRRFSPTMQKGKIVRLPPILAINCGGVTAHEKAYWAKGVQKDIPEGTKRSGNGKPCRYGMQCARPGCRFKHPDRPCSSSSHSRSPTDESHCVLPHQIQIQVHTDGDIVINDKTTEFLEKTKNANLGNSSADNKKNEEKHIEEEYTLTAAVFCIEDNPKNLVSCIKVPGVNSEPPQWYLFNDLSIVPVIPEEVVQFSSWWKSPCVVFYTSQVLTPACVTVEPEYVQENINP